MVSTKYICIKMLIFPTQDVRKGLQYMYGIRNRKQKLVTKGIINDNSK